MPDESDKFLVYLKSKIRQYRLEMLTDFYDTPQLLMGDGLRSFELLSLFIPTLTVGPRGYPVPGGAFSASDNALKYPVQTVESRDVFQSKDYRNVRLDDSHVAGGEVVPLDDLSRWNQRELVRTCIAGASAAANIAEGVADRYTEVKIHYIHVIPDDAPQPLTMTFTFAATGGVWGHAQPAVISFQWDFTVNNLLHGAPNIVFGLGKKMMTANTNRAITWSVAGGAGIEVCTIGLSVRWI